MNQAVALWLWFAIIGTCLPIHVESFVHPTGSHRTTILPRTSSGSAGSIATKQVVRRHMSEQKEDDNEKIQPKIPQTPPPSDGLSDKDDPEMTIPSEETVEAERPRVPVPEPPKPVPPPVQKQVQIKKPTKPSRSLTPDEEKLALASGVGGLFVGALLGITVDIEYPNIDLIMSPIVPPLFSSVFVSTVGYVFGGSEGGLGKLVRTIFGAPTVLVGNTITSLIDAAINNAVTSAKTKVKETTDDIIAIPGKIANEIKATPGRVAEAAVETATGIAEEIKATPGKVADAAVETATEIADEIKATPGRVVKQTKKAVEDVVDDTLDAVEDFVDDVKAIPQKAIDGVESALGVTKPVSPRPPLAPGTSSAKTPLPPKDLPGSTSKPKQSLIPSISSLKIPELANPKAKAASPKKPSVDLRPPPKDKPANTESPKFELPKFDIAKTPKQAAPKQAAPKKKIEYKFPSESPPSKTETPKTTPANKEAPKFELPKFDIPKASKKATPKQAAPKKKIEFKFPSESPPSKTEAPKTKPATKEAPKFGLLKFDIPKSPKEAAPKKRIEYNFPSESPPSKTESPKFELPKFGSPPKKAATTESKVGTQAADAALKRKKEAEARRVREEQAKRKQIEDAEQIKRQKRLEQEQKASKLAEAAAERKRIQEEKEAQRIAAIKKAQEIKRKKQSEAAERKRMQAQAKQEKIEAQRKADEKRRQQAEEKRRQAADKAQRKQVAAKSLGQARSRTTISLGNIFGGNAAEQSNEVEVDLVKSAAPPGVPVVSNWKQNPDGSISGRISGSPNFTNGDVVTTSPVPQGATSNSVVKTSSGSRYFLEQEQQIKGFSFGFGIQNSRKEEEVIASSEDEKASASPLFGMKRNPAGESKGSAADEKKVTAATAAEERRSKAAAAAEAKKQAAEEKKAKAVALAEQRRAAAEAKKQAAEEKKAKAVALAEQRRVAAEAKRQAAEEKKAKAAALAEQRKAEAEAKRQAAEEKKAATLAGQRRDSGRSPGFLQKKRDAPKVTTTPKITAAPPKGVPVIKSWKKRSDGGISGRIYGSPSFEDGDFIETSPISNGKIDNGSVVSTKSRSRYFLSAETAENKSNIMAAFKDLAGAKPGATITLTKERKEREAKAAIEAIEKAKPRSTFSLFGLGLGDLDEKSPPKKEMTKVPRKENKRKQIANPKVKVAPKGVPTLGRWKMNRDGSITGLISGSPNFKDGEQVTTSMIAKGRIDSCEVVTTGSGSRYFLE